MNLRRAVAADAETIAALHVSSWRLTYSSVLSAPYLDQAAPSERRAAWSQRLRTPKANQYVVVAEEETHLLGFACVFAGEHEQWGSYLDNLHVDTEAQGRGVGKALLANAAAWCEHYLPGKGLYLSVSQENRRAQTFYLALGARNAQVAPWHAPDGSVVPSYLFVWDTVHALVRHATAFATEQIAGLQCERLVFRKWTAADDPLAWALWGDRAVTALIGGPFSAAQVTARLRREIEYCASSGVQYWPVFERSTGEFVGCCGLRPYRLAERVFELGFHIRPQHAGRGFATEAARAVIRHAFESLDVSALFAGHHPSNRASAHILSKLGFRYSHHELYPPTGLEHPSYLLQRPAVNAGRGT